MPNLLLSGRAQQLHGPLPLCCCQRFPGPSRNSLLEKGRQSPKEVSPWPSSFSMKNKSTSRSPKAFSLPRRISLPSSSLSFSGLGSIPLSERRQAFFHSPFGAPGLFWFEHRLKHDWRGPSYAMRSIQKSLREAAGMTKRGRFPVLH